MLYFTTKLPRLQVLFQNHKKFARFIKFDRKEDIMKRFKCSGACSCSCSRSSYISYLRYAIPSLLTLLWIAFIFSNSLKSGAESGNQSKEFLSIIAPLFPTLTESVLRTMAHFGEFALLSLLLCWDLVAFRSIHFERPISSILLRLLPVLPAGSLIALADECIQLFSDGRAFQLSDILTDTLGVATAAFLFFLFFTGFRALFQKRKQKSPKGSVR